MRKLMTGIAVLLLVGCATPQEMMQAPPDAVLKLKGAPQAGALCITRNLENYASNMIVNMRPTPEGWEVISRLTGEATTIYAIAQLRPSGPGSEAQIWAAQQIFTGTDAVVKQIVKGC
jgi:hypothetical protein